MADITDQKAIDFSNQYVRPLSEVARALKARVADATNAWFLGMNAKFPNDASVLQDGRTDVPFTLTGADVNGIMAGLIGATADASLNPQVIEKGCVRPLQVTVPGS